MRFSNNHRKKKEKEIVLPLKVKLQINRFQSLQMSVCSLPLPTLMNSLKETLVCSQATNQRET